MKIFCIGRNYKAHAEELQNAVPTEPVVFMKPETSLMKTSEFYLPTFSNDIHYEVELVLKINKMGKYIQPDFAMDYFDEIALGIDFTARDIQKKLKEKGLPWEKAKAFDNAAAVGEFIPKSKVDLHHLSFSLNKNGKSVQSGNTADMIFSIPDILVFVSQYFSIKKGDLIYTGTPAGVGKVEENDRLIGYLEGKENFNIQIL